MAEGTGIAGLAGSLAEKLARDVRCVYKQQQEVSACSGNQSLLIVSVEPWSCAGLSVGEALEREPANRRGLCNVLGGLRGML